MTDTTPGNDSGNGSDTTAVSATTDVKITAQSETAPASANTGADFTITVDKTLHNNGSTGPVDVSITPSVSGPADCTITPAVANPASANLAVSTATPVTENFTVNCTNPSTHTFSIDNCIAITTLHVSDSNSANNCSPTTQVSVDILATADLKIPAVTISGPASITINTAFNIEATADAHNNGPATPVNADTTFTLTLPTDCTTPSTNPETLQDTPLPVSVNTTVSGAPVSWTVTCTDPVAHTFVAEALVTIDQLHVADPISSNDKLTDEVIITPPTPTTFTVLKDFSDDNPADVTVSLTCSTGTVTTDDATASESDPADFTVDGATTGTSCTATEFPIPVGYTSTGTCNAPLSVGTCTIINSIGGGGGGTPNPVGGIVGLLGAPDDGPQSAAQGGNNVMLVLALAAGAAILIAATSAWVSRTVRRP